MHQCSHGHTACLDTASLGPWTQQLNVPWTPRAAHGCAAHTVVTNATLGDASRTTFLFLMGGWRETSLNDVWRMDAAGVCSCACQTEALICTTLQS